MTNTSLIDEETPMEVRFPMTQADVQSMNRRIDDLAKNTAANHEAVIMQLALLAAALKFPDPAHCIQSLKVQKLELAVEDLQKKSLVTETQKGLGHWLLSGGIANIISMLVVLYFLLELVRNYLPK